nr:hypothetical protein BaRGS_014159 [Batillaria attramentaria]
MIAVFFAKSGHVATVPLLERKTVNAEWYINTCLPKRYEKNFHAVSMLTAPLGLGKKKKKKKKKLELREKFSEKKPNAASRKAIAGSSRRKDGEESKEAEFFFS